MNFSINIDNDALVKFTNRLEQLSRSALPVVVRQTLNNAGFDLKKNTMPTEAERTFTQRQANFFKVTSKVNMATGFDIDKMQCEVGFTAPDKYANQAVADLEVQEEGGQLERHFVPMDTARTGGTNKGLVKANNRLTAIKKIINARNSRGINKGQQMIKAAVFAGKDGFIIAPDRKGRDILWRVQDLSRLNGNTKMSLVPLYNYATGRRVQIDKRAFMDRASAETAKKMETFFNANAERQFEKALEI